MAYYEFPLETTVEQLVDRALERIRENITGWEPREAHLEVAVLEEMTRLVAEARMVAATVPDNVFALFGENMIGIPKGAGARATGTVTFTAIDDSGYNVPAGTLVLARVTGDETVGFTVDSTTTIAAGTTSVNVPVTAEDEGEHANGFDATTELELVDSIVWVDSVVLADTTSGGADAEDDVAYRDRLAAELQLMSPRPILPRDFELLAARVEGVGRAKAIDGYDPDTGTENNERTVAISAVHADGTALTSDQERDVEVYLNELREINFVVKWLAVTYTAVAVDFTIVVSEGYDADAVVADAVAAAEAYISPANWAGGDESPPRWRDWTTVRYLAVVASVAIVEGVSYVSNLTLNGTSADLALSGRAPLPAPLSGVASPSTVNGAAA